MIYPWVLFASVVGTFLLVGPAHRRFGKRTTAIAGGLIGMVFWVTPFVLRHLHLRSEEHTSELQSLMRISYAVFCLKKKKHIILLRPFSISLFYIIITLI